MKKDFTALQLNTISHSGTILRTCDALPFTLANKVNACVSAANLALKEHQSAFELIEERKTSSKKTNEQEAIKMETEARESLNKITYPIELADLKQTEFAGIEISGSKDVLTQAGLINYHYRDAYFNLLDLIIF